MIFTSINNAIEKAIGASGLNPVQRSELRAEQIAAVVQITPGMVIGSTLIVVLLLWLSYDTVVFTNILVWAGVLAAALSIGMLSWLRSRKKPGKKLVSQKAIAKVCFNASLVGGLWGILPFLMLPVSGTDMKLATAISITGILCGSGFAFASIPQAVIAFTVPVFLGIMASLPFTTNELHVISVGFLTCSYVLVIPFITIRYARNLAQHVITEIAMREQKNIIGLLLNEYEENASDWLWEFDCSGTIQRASLRFASACGRRPEELSGLNFVEFLKSHAVKEAPVTEIEKQILDCVQFRNVEVCFSINGETHWWHLTGKPSYDENGNFTGYIGIGSDVSADKHAENKISKLAHTDPLTGLMNRAKFTEQMEVAVSKLERYGASFSVMFLDLDRFKLVNDTRGHHVGDKLLKSIGQRITTIVRETDNVARLGGDEFAILMHEQCDAGSAARLAAKMIQEVSKPYDIDGERHKIGVSIGIALAPQNGTQPTQLLRNADLALYRSKADGKGVFRFFESQMDAEQREKRMLEHELREAIDNNEFELYYQPLVSPSTGRPTGMEALIRWNHPIRGLISPAEFIPIAEQSSLIQEIGNWTIHEACMTAVDWPEDVVVAVNLSAQHFNGSDIITHTKKALEESKLPPNRFELEITESLLINNTDEVFKILQSLKDLGVSIALDDFGTGYSSLSYILKFPFDKIKIDRSFVSALGEDDAAKAILRMISSLGESLDIRITAEGVETIEQIGRASCRERV